MSARPLLSPVRENTPHGHGHGHGHGHENAPHGHGHGGHREHREHREHGAHGAHGAHGQHGHGHGSQCTHDHHVTPSPSSSRCCCCCGNSGNLNSGTRKSLSRLSCALVICMLFAASEMVGGYLAGSLAIMTDAAHLLSDVASFGVSIFALCMSRRAATSKYTFGMRRAETVGALVSILIIWLITGILIYEGVLRVQRIVAAPQAKHVEGRLMFIVACGGVVVNCALMCVLTASGASHSHSHGGGGGGGHHGHSHTMSERAAYIHAIGDLVQSLGVVVAGGIIWWKSDGEGGNGWYQLADPICTFFFGLLVLFTTKQIFTDVLHIFLMRAPAISEGGMASLLEDIRALPFVQNCHDFHAFSVSAEFPVLIGHVVVQNGGGDGGGGGPGDRHDDYSSMLAAIKARCVARGIDHVTIQLEPADGRTVLDCSCPVHDG
jgi:zinc transporter 2